MKDLDLCPKKEILINPLKRSLYLVILGTILCLVFGFVPVSAQETVLFFDDFNGAGLNSAAWQFQSNSSGANVTVSGGEAIIQSGTTNGGGGSIITNQEWATSNDTLIFEVRSRVTETDWLFSVGLRGNGFDGGGMMMGIIHSTTLELDARSDANNSGNDGMELVMPQINLLDWHVYRIELSPSSARFYIDGQLAGVINDPTKLPIGDLMHVRLDKGSDGSNETLYLDYVRVTSVPATTLIVAIDPVNVWVGLKNSDDVGIKFDLKAEVYKNADLIAVGTLDSVLGGSSGFNNAHLYSIPITLTAPVAFPGGSTLSINVYVRNACAGSGKNSGRARLWYNDAAANSHFGATIGANSSDYYLLAGSVLGTTEGVGPKMTYDTQAGAKCSPYKLWATWSLTL